MIAIFLFIFILGIAGFSAEPVLVKDPKPTHVEKPFKKLIKTGEIPLDFEEENFFARPYELQVDKDGTLFVIDDILDKILIFDSKLKFIRSFGKVGRGPGDWGQAKKGRKHIYLAQDSNLYVSDYQNNKTIVFDKKGNLVKELFFRFKYPITFYPVTDSKNNYYVISRSGGAVDVYDKNLEKTRTLLSKADYMKFAMRVPFLGSNPTDKQTREYIASAVPSDFDTLYDIFPGNGLIIYLCYSSTAYIFRDNKLVRRFDILPEKAIKSFKTRIGRMRIKLKNDESYSMQMFNQFFVDKENGKYFYLQINSYEPKGGLLYKFDLQGQLIDVYFLEHAIWIKAKRNNRYYAIGDDYIHIFEEKK